jgi:hypothetical protein
MSEYNSPLQYRCRNTKVHYSIDVGIQQSAKVSMSKYNGPLQYRCRNTTVCYSIDVGIQRSATVSMSEYKGPLQYRCPNSVLYTLHSNKLHKPCAKQKVRAVLLLVTTVRVIQVGLEVDMCRVPMSRSRIHEQFC